MATETPDQRPDRQHGPILGRVAPFRYLAQAERDALASELVELHFERGASILRQGDEADTRLMLLARGRAETVDVAGMPPKHLGVIQPGNFFGERSALFDVPRRHEVRALEDVTCYALAGERFLELLHESSVFAQAMGAILREKRGIFVAFDRFQAELQHGVAQGRIALRELLPLYRALEPALHPLLDSSEIDFGALSYAVRRLPENVTRTLMLFLTDELPEFYAGLAREFRAVPTAARPRSVWEMMPGKSMVLLRDGQSDLVDLVSCLCLYAIEARKLRKRLRSPSAVANLAALATRAARASAAPTAAPTEVAHPAAGARAERVQRELLAQLPFTPGEVEGLLRIWPNEAVARVRDLAVQHEDIACEIRRQVHHASTRHAQAWTEQIAGATRELLGCDPASLPESTRVHVICSNTHSVQNCLSSFLAGRREAILAWGQATQPELCAAHWNERTDLVYALARGYAAAHPQEAAARDAADAHSGMRRVAHSAFTGILVDVIDLRRLTGRHVDPALPVLERSCDALVINIDFAFGQQAEEIVANLLRLFGRRLDSFNVLGKAGALAGARGDVLVPTAFVEQRQDLLEQLPGLAHIDAQALHGRLGGRALHVGPMLTVAGTLLQNRMMLQFYRHVWGTIGLEMEGWFYLRKLLDAIDLSMVKRELALRFLYYVSDLPLDARATLSGRMPPAEGIPPLYAITREILTRIFETERARAARG
jgi:CRP-like cAMP-binding protein